MFRKYIKKIVNKMGYEINKYPQIILDKRQFNNLSYFIDMYKRIDNIDGDIVECGVGKGRSFVYLSFLAQRDNKDRNLWGFDSFEGFPEPTEEDKSKRNPQKGEWADTSPRYIKSLLINSGIDENFIKYKIKLIKGYFNESLSKYNGKKIALLHIDSDLYQSYTDVLNKLFDKVADGGLVLFDEYNEENWPGAKRAVDDFFKNTKYKILYNEKSGKYYIIK